MRDLGVALALFVLLAVPSASYSQQDPKDKGFKPNVAVDQASVDKAIASGLQFLKSSDSPGTHVGDSDELKLLTLIEGGVPESDPALGALLKKALEAPLDKTYKVALLAMCLEELDRHKYQSKIAQCGQFLLDNIKPNGGFCYGEATTSDVNYALPKREVASGGAKAPPPAAEAGEPRAKPEVRSKIKLTKKRDGPAQRSDNSNCQYAALGMRACHDAGIVFPKAEIERCRQYWIATQHPGEKGAAKDRPAIASGGNSVPVGDPRGWCYSDGQGSDCGHGGNAYGSMTAGAIGAICIFDYMLGKDWKKDKPVLDGLAWLDKNWSVTENVGPAETAKGQPTGWLYYYLYALERTGMLYDTALIGNHDWYLDGARQLLAAQKPDGSWDASHFKHPTWDTCFAILFLKRATKRLVASTGK
jgi:hypothetical protein